jgi:hypothetical protein
MSNSASLFFVVLAFKTKAKTTSFNINQSKKNRLGLIRVLPGSPGPGSTGFHRANSQAGFCLHPDRSQARVGWVPGRPAGPVRVLKHWQKPKPNRLISVRFGYFILKTKNYIVFWVFFVISNGFGFSLAWFFRFGLAWFFGSVQFFNFR